MPVSTKTVQDLTGIIGSDKCGKNEVNKIILILNGIILAQENGYMQFHFRWGMIFKILSATDSCRSGTV